MFTTGKEQLHRHMSLFQYKKKSIKILINLENEQYYISHHI